MSQSGKDSGFRKGARKASNVILTINLIGTLVVIIVMIAFIVWITSQS